MRRLASSKAAIVFVILAGLALVIPNLVAAAFQRVFVDEILVQGHHDWLKPLLLAMALTAVLRLAAAALQQFYLTRLEVRLTLDESLKFLEHVLRLPLTFFQRRYTGDLVARVSSTARVAGLISGELATTAVSLLTLVVYVAVMLPYDPLLAVVGVGISSLNLVALKWFSRWRTDQNRAIEQIRGRLMAGIMGAIQIIESIKATGSESDLLVRWTGDQARMINAEQTLGVCDALLFVLPPLLASLTTIVVLGLGGRQVMVGGLSIGVLVAFQSLLAGFNQPFLDLARLGAEVQELRADLDRIDDVRNRPIDPVFASPQAVALAADIERGRQRGRAAAPAERSHRVPAGHLRLQPDGRGTADQGFLVRGRSPASGLPWSAARGAANRRSAGWPRVCISRGAARSSTTAMPLADALPRGLRQLGRAGRFGNLPVRGNGARQPDALGRPRPDGAADAGGSRRGDSPRPASAARRLRRGGRRAGAELLRRPAPAAADRPGAGASNPAC